MKSIVVTGASTGIGWGCVKVLTGKGFRVFGSVRKQADADRLSKEFGASFTPLIFDVTDEAAVTEALDIAESPGPVRINVNCAGIGNVVKTVSRKKFGALDAARQIIAQGEMQIRQLGGNPNAPATTTTKKPATTSSKKWPISWRMSWVEAGSGRWKLPTKRSRSAEKPTRL